MKFKRKLVADTDGEPISPKVLLDNVGDSNRTIPSCNTSNNKLRGRTSYESMGNYLISIFEPGQGKSSNASRFNQQSSQVSSISQNNRQTGNFTQNSLSLQGEQHIERERRLDKQLTRLKEEAEHNKKRSCRLLFQKNNILQGIVQSQKIKNLKKNFIKKIRRSSTLHPPIDYKIAEQEGNSILDYRGFEVQPLVESLINLVSVIQIISLLVIYSISFVFEDLLSGEYTFIEAVQLTSFIFYFAQIVKNLVTVKFSAGKRIQIIRQIIQHYVKQDFWVDLVSFIILMLDITSQVHFITFFRMFIIFKLPQCLNKIEKLEVYFVRNVYNQQYWELAKVFLVNFCYAHIIAIFLGAMAGMDPTNNWLLHKGLIGSPWIERYVWSVYWATNIMLTVGFGDIAAANHQEAVCLIFIETLSCIIMAYNINRVGSIINNIRLEDQNRSKKFKIFQKLTDQNTVSEQLTFKINNYIEESSKIKKKFNYEEDQDFLKELPDTLRKTYLKEANKEILNKLIFFKSLLDRTLCNFSQMLETKISHPQEVIRALEDDFNLIILRKGHIGYSCKKNGCGFNDAIADEIRVSSGDLPFLTSLDFVSKTRPQYEIKSLQFSVLFTMEYEKFIEIFRKSDMDYELFCFLRDKCRNIPDEFQVKPCEFCKQFNHFKFTCPRLHYVPYEQHVINKEIYKTSKGQNYRRQYERTKNMDFTPMEYYKKVKGYRDDLIKGRTRINSTQNNILQSTLANIKMHNSESVRRPRTMTTIEKLRDERIREVIEEQLLKRDKETNFEDEVWSIHLDVMANFNGYFSKDNPKYLAEKFSRESRMTQRKLRQKAGLETYPPESDEINEMVDDYELRNFTQFYEEISGSQ